MLSLVIYDTDVWTFFFFFFNMFYIFGPKLQNKFQDDSNSYTDITVLFEITILFQIH